MVMLMQETIRYMIPMMLVALAGVYAERSGIINLALEGIMVIGAFACAMFLRMFQEMGVFGEMHQLSIIVGLLIAGGMGAVFSSLLSYAAIRWKADQTISGTALNMIAPALVLFIAAALFQQEKITMKTSPASWCMIWVDIEGEGFFQDIGRILLQKTYIKTFIGIAIFIILSIVLYKTKFGLRLRSCGEHPQAAGSLGINVNMMRYIGTTISGALAGIGGYIFSLTIVNGSATGEVAGFGFLALAIMIFGNWKPGNIVLVSFLFGLLKCISATFDSIDINGDGIFALKQLSDNSAFFSPYLYKILPFLATLIVLAFTSKKSRAPKAEGIPYDKGMR